jgi:N-acetylmuramoyl-L-alanine amidase
MQRNIHHSLQHRPQSPALAAAAFALVSFTALSGATAQAKPIPFKVVIDPGHGGSDHGTVYYHGTYPIAEKTVTLMIARQVAAQLRAEGIDVTLTRRDDRDLPLGKRTELANRMGADIFLSIHMNSAPGTDQKAEGVETFILNNATDASSRRLAHLENTVISKEGLDTPQQEDVALILRDMRLDANLSESKRLACAIQNSLAGKPQVSHAAAAHPAQSAARAPAQKNRGVKQALFHVLLGADMPSVLVEAGFLSSPKDRAIVLSAEGRKRMGASIARAIEQFRALKGTRAASVALSRCRVR